MEEIRMKFKYRIGTKVYEILWFGISIGIFYLIYKGMISKIYQQILGGIFCIGGIIDGVYTLIMDRPIEITEKGIGYYVGKKLKYFCEWNKIQKVIIPYYDNENNGKIKIYSPDKVIRIGTGIVTEDGKRGIEIIIEYIKKNVDLFKIKNKKEEWRNRIGEKGDAEFHSWIKGAK